MRRALSTVLLLSALACATAPAPPAPAPPTATRTGVARLAALSFSPGPPSGSRIDGGPFPSQPVQGFSGLLAQGDGGFLALTDNGYGTVESSSDFLLRVYALSADFAAQALTATPVFSLNDQGHQVPFPLVRGLGDRLLTGADFDVESFAQLPDGTFWFGDETGPFLLHTDARGTLLEPPIGLSEGLDGGALISVDHPLLQKNLMLHTLEALRGDALEHHALPPHFSPHETLLTSPQQLAQLHAAGFRVLPWTVNAPERLAELAQWGADGLISDRPDLARAAADGGVEVQGHRGARGLAPETTLPAFEAGLRAGADTLEADLSATRDGAILWHDAALVPEKCRGEGPRTLASLTTAQAQRFTCDRTLARFPLQSTAVSKEVNAFSKGRPFAPLTLEALFRFAGGDPRVRFNVETKVHDAQGADAARLTRLLGQATRAAGLEGRVSLQSFDWRSLRTAFAEFPGLQTVALLEEEMMAAPAAGRAGLPWPAATLPTPRVGRSSGFESLALSPDGASLIAMLEKPLAGGPRELLAFRFSLQRKGFEGVAFRFPLHPRATAVGDLALLPDGTGYALERDDSEGKREGYKRLVRFRLPAVPGALVERADAADLAALDFPFFCIEGVAVLPSGEVAILNDNNFPFGRARSPTAPDGTELITARPAP